MRGGFDYDRAATILTEAAYHGDQDTARRWGISERTIYRYRKRFGRDDKLSELVKQKKQAFERGWADDLPSSIKAGIDFLKRAAQSADQNNPDVIHAIAGALKIQTEVAVTKDILDARLARERGQANTADGPLAAAGHNGDLGNSPVATDPE
jgi:hypothetical protein